MMSGSDILLTTIHVITDWPIMTKTSHDQDLTTAVLYSDLCSQLLGFTVGTSSWCCTLPGSAHSL
ncbi:unnamed protein product [Staurois parvus]|uniref:Uncharacterized protein n=1 Tax=Staurois parvus TaxID=386267 RepID=A0ABN9G5S0_9NEOB|nr:unnamed protein product [Staurois parvus]